MNRDPREDFESLKNDIAPPSPLEDRTVAALKERGLLRADPRWRHPIRLTGWAAAAILLLALGFAAGRLTARPATADDGAATFALLLRAGDAPAPVTPREEARLVREYSDWAAEQKARGRLVDGEKLSDERRILRREDDSLTIVPTSARAEPRAVLGYFLIRAAGYQEAVALAADCPHLRHGGEIEVREIATR